MLMRLQSLQNKQKTHLKNNFKLHEKIVPEVTLTKKIIIKKEPTSTKTEVANKKNKSKC